jgi:hydrogenase nickel incorporation protein HypA/HybF
MHELGIAHSVLDAVRTEAERHPGAFPVKVAVRVGELAGVDPDALAFSFEVLTSKTEWARVVLEVQTCPRKHCCRDCGNTFRIVDYDFACPACGGLHSECIGGEELELAYVELEES